MRGAVCWADGAGHPPLLSTTHLPCTPAPILAPLFSSFPRLQLPQLGNKRIISAHMDALAHPNLTNPNRPPCAGCNCLNLGNERIISVHMETARQIVQSPHFFGDVQYIDYRWAVHRWGGSGGGGVSRAAPTPSVMSRTLSTGEGMRVPCSGAWGSSMPRQRAQQQGQVQKGSQHCLVPASPLPHTTTPTPHTHSFTHPLLLHLPCSPITSMYGAVHCSSQVVKRVPRRF